MANKRWSKKPSSPPPPTGHRATGDGISPKVKPVGYPGLPGKAQSGNRSGGTPKQGRAKFIVDSQGL